jgi:hypothetical protein
MPRRTPAKFIAYVISLSLLGLACGLFGPGAATPTPTAQPLAEASPTLPQPTSASGSFEAPTETATLAALQPKDTAVPPTAAPTDPPLQLSDAEWAVFDAFETANFQANDPIELARSIQGVTVPETRATEPAPVLGEVREFWIHNTSSNTWSTIEARLERVSEHAYFWFDVRAQVPDGDLDQAVLGFEAFYDAARELYGSEPAPGIDGDGRIYIVHASPLALCGTGACGLLGYFSTSDLLPLAVNPRSNQHEMFVLNVSRKIGGLGYLSTLVHEFRHMIEHNYDRHDDDWEVEGTATVAQLLAGDEVGPRGRAAAYLDNVDIQLNAWSEGSPDPNYGKGYVYSRYLLDRLGTEFYAAWVQHPERAFIAIDEVLDDFGFEVSALDLWIDFGAAVALLGEVEAGPEFSFGLGFHGMHADKAPISNFPATIDTSVHQFGIDIYEIGSAAGQTIQFNGAQRTGVFDGALPADGAFMWWSGRANQSDMSLTHQFDLSGVSSATLLYDAFFEIERGYDFAYLFVSADDGESWQPLVAEHMSGLDPRDNPGGSALTDRFYSGPGGKWLAEQVDLSAYAGQRILVRFQYLTDPIFTGSGLLLDNIRIPEIGFEDGAENGVGEWTAVGFLRSTAFVPQRFHVTWIGVDPSSGAPIVERLLLDDVNRVSFAVPDGQSQGFLVVTASNALILTPASYSLTLEP